MSTDETTGGSRATSGPPSAAALGLPTIRWPVAIFLALAVGIGIAGYSYDRHAENTLIAETHKALASIAELKIGEIHSWREEQLRDAVMATENRTMERAVADFLRDPEAGTARDEAFQWLSTLKRAYDYQSVLILDPVGKPRLAASGDVAAVGPNLAGEIGVVRNSRQPLLSDLHSAGTVFGPVHMDLLAPFYTDDSKSQIVAFLLIRIDPARFLFPLIQSWPVPSASAESLLVRRDGDAVLFLNELRHRKDTSMRLRLPLDDPDLPSSRVARGERGAMRGRDYRNTHVIAYAEDIPDTPWFLVAKLDEEEALSSARAQRLLLAGFVAVMILASGLAAALMWNRQRADAYRQLYHAEAERLQVEEALRRSEDRLRLAQDAANAGSWEWDVRTNRNFWSEELWRLYGLEPHSLEPSYEAWLQTVHPDDRQKTEDAVRQAARHGTELNAEWRVMHPDGTEHWLMSRGRPVGDKDGQAVGYIGIVMDITGRKRAEVALRQWADAFRHCAHGIAIGIPATNTLQTCNPAFARLHGRTVEDLVGSSILDLYEPSEHEHVKRSIEEADREGQVQYESRMRRKDGSSFPVQMDLVSIRDEDGNPLYRVATAQDITRRKEAMNALRASLEDKVALLKEVHHRVKNNLQIVASLLNLQANRSQSPQVIDVLQDTGNRVRSMALLHEVLYASGNLASINFAAYVEELCRQLLRSFGQAAARVEIEKRVARIGLPLEQSVPCGLIINELLSNALKHGFPDGQAGKITVELQPIDQERLLLCVHDDGVGLGPDFDPANTATLGLQLVSSLAGQLGGQLSVDRKNGVGAAFYVAFRVSDMILTDIEPQNRTILDR